MAKKSKKASDKEKEIKNKEAKVDKKSSKAEKKENKETSKEEVVEEKEEVSIEDKFNEINNKYLRLSAEFDNYRKRSLKEKMDLIKSAGEDILVNILPVMDNFERALNSINENNDADSTKEGIELIYNNFNDFLKQRGVQEIEAVGKELDTDFHEAITKIPAQKEEQKGKIIDVIEKGYLLHGKVIRFAKVVVGE